MARPTKYKKQYCQDIIDYFLLCGEAEIKKVVISESYYKGKDGEKGALKEKKYKLIADNLPFFSAFAEKIGVHVDTLLEWVKVKEGFSEAYKKAKDIQKRVLIKNGLAGMWNPAFSIFTAKNLTDMRDKKEVELHVSDLGQFLKEIRDAKRPWVKKENTSPLRQDIFSTA